MGDDLSDELRPQLLGQVVAHTREHDETRLGHRIVGTVRAFDIEEAILCNSSRLPP